MIAPGVIKLRGSEQEQCNCRVVSVCVKLEAVDLVGHGNNLRKE